MFCTKCGALNDEGAKFCGACGASLEVNVVEIRSESEHVVQPQVKNENPKNKKKKGAIIAAVAVILIALVVAGFLALKGVNEKSRYDDLLAKGNKFYEEMDYEAAEAVFLEAISVNPKKVDAYLMLADVYIADGEPEKAEDVLDDAEENVPDNEDVIDKKEEIKGYVKYEWVVEPQIEADNVFYAKEAFGVTENNEYKQWMQEYVVVERDGLYAVADMKGNLLCDFVYKDVSPYYDILLLFREEPIYEPQYDMEWDTYGLFDGVIQPVEGLGGGWPGNEYYYCNGIHNFFDVSGLEKEYVSNYSAVPLNAVPVMEMPYILSGEDYELLNPVYNKEARYGIFNDGQMITAFEFEQCGSLSEGLFAARKDGKWGYLNENGDIIIPFEYDPSWGWQAGNVYDGYVYFEYAYSATEGFVVLNKEGRWSIKNTEGKLVIPEGTFEQICPVYEGKCWVKKDGKWGIIELVLPEGEKPVQIDDGWKEAFIDYINMNYTSDMSCTLAYIDDDDVPELIIDYGYTAAGGEICVYEGNGVINTVSVSAGGVAYIEGSGLCSDGNGRMDVYFDRVYKVNSGQIEMTAYGDYGAVDNSNIEFDEYGMPIYVYYWMDEEVSSEEYGRLLKQIFDYDMAIWAYERAVPSDEMIRNLQNN